MASDHVEKWANGQPHVVIVGGGFGGLNAARALRRAPARVTLVDRRNFHLFQPLLYQVAMGQLSPANIAAPLRAILGGQKNTRVLLGEAIGVDAAQRRLCLRDEDIPYDFLIVAAGSRHHYFGRAEWEARAPGLKTVEDATEIRRRVLFAFEAAERESDPERQRALLTFVVVGGGPTGVELAGALAEMAHRTLRREFRHCRPTQARVLLAEGTDRLLPTFPAVLSARAARALQSLGVEVRTGTVVTELDPDFVTLRRGQSSESLPAQTVLWAAGVEASPLGRTLADAGAVLDRSGRVIVQADLSIPGHPEIFVIGDLANYSHQAGKPLPGVAPVAMQQGSYVAGLIDKRLRGQSVPPFRYKDRGNMATIGRSLAVADFGWVHLSGTLAWLAWLFIHLMFLVHFQNRVLVFIQWAVHYVTGNRPARLITAPWQPLVRAETSDTQSATHV